MHPTGKPFVSTALDANLALTRADVVIPGEEKVLLDTVTAHFGVRQLAERMLKELHHPLRNPRVVSQELRDLTGGMLHYYEGSEQRRLCMMRLEGIFAELYPSLEDEAEVQTLARTHLQFLERLANSPYREEYSDPLQEGVAALEKVCALHPSALLVHGGLVRRLAGKLGHDTPAGARTAVLYGTLCSDAMADWVRILERPISGVTWGTDPLGALEAFAPFRTTIERAMAVAASNVEPATRLELPSPQELLNAFFTAVDTVPSLIDRVTILVDLLGEPEFQYRSREVLRRLYFALQQLCASGDSHEVSRAVDLITGCLKADDQREKQWLFEGITRLGEEIARRGDFQLIEHFIDRFIATGFEPPGIKGTTEEWEVEVNPYHLVCLRTWLAVIRSDPRRFERLLSALAIQLHFRGVFVNDTDLFQRDISQLLNGGVAKSFSLVLQLVRHLPVFFSAVGSEGELREVSTRIDQISYRQDAVIHFLRKQAHAESNSRLVEFTRAVYTWWRTGDATHLDPFIPESLRRSLSPDDPWFQGAHDALSGLENTTGLTEKDLDELPVDAFAEGLQSVGSVDPVHRERALLLVRLYRLLKAKYDYDPGETLDALEGSNLVPHEHRKLFEAAVAGGDHLEILHHGHTLLEDLKAVVTDPSKTEPFENLYYKRHIAVGIPSVYGTYHEPKFDALGLMLRLMRFLTVHLEACIAEFPTGFMTRDTLLRAASLMHEILRALGVAGLRVKNLSEQVGLLKEVLDWGNLTVGQYLNLLEMISEALGNSVEVNFIAPHERNLERILPDLLADRDLDEQELLEAKGALAEEFLRSTVASIYGVQELDLFVNRVREGLRIMTDTLSRNACVAVLAYRADRLVRPIQGEGDVHPDPLFVGAKGAGLQRLASLGLPIPPGFILSTELFRILPALGHGALMEDTRRRIRRALDEMEAATGRRLGDPDRPLLLSVRSGAAFSMPGMMDTILNVGLNDEIVEAMAHDELSAWTAWDSYRRFIQNVAMSQGVDRDAFDAIMLEFKERHNIARKMEFSAEQMKTLALSYRELAGERGALPEDDPFEQLLQAVFLVLRSWGSEGARLFRQRLGLAEEWGTAVIVQRMVFGNLGANSGSGVVFTRDPWSSHTGVELYGDFTRCSQGEDVVAGLVHPLPISEKQRLTRESKEPMSMETAFPEVYTRLREIAERLILEEGFEHQEIEFTFESERAGDLYLLQTRPLRLLRQEKTVVFAHTESLMKSLLTRGTGVSGGAISGAIAFTMDDIRRLKDEDPKLPVILVRPDTVPEDIPLLLQADGLLTSRGGATSHAAITAKRLGKVCVVNCHDLVVVEGEHGAKIGNRRFETGDMVSIDGVLGNVYEGRHEVLTTAAHRASIRGGIT